MTPVLFTYQDATIRTAGTPDKPFFVASDVCRALEIVDHASACRALSEKQKGVHTVPTLGGPQQMLCVTEGGLYKLVFISRKPEAEKFQEWITDEVIPAIRKTGKYEVAPVVPALPQTFAEALRALADTVEEKERLALALADAEPKVAFFNAVTDSKSAIEMAAVAKVLAVPGFGRTKLFAFLRDRKILRKNNQPMQEYVDRGYFRVIEQKWNTPDGEVRVTCKTLVFQKGLEYIRMILPQ